MFCLLLLIGQCSLSLPWNYVDLLVSSLHVSYGLIDCVPLYIFCDPLERHVLVLLCVSCEGTFLLACLSAFVVTSDYGIHAVNNECIQDSLVNGCNSIFSSVREFLRSRSVLHELVVCRLYYSSCVVIWKCIRWWSGHDYFDSYSKYLFPSDESVKQICL